MFYNEKPAWKRFIYRVLGAYLILVPFALFFFDAIDFFEAFLGVLIGTSVIFLFEYFVEDHFARQKRKRERESEEAQGSIEKESAGSGLISVEPKAEGLGFDARVVSIQRERDRLTPGAARVALELWVSPDDVEAFHRFLRSDGVHCQSVRIAGGW